MYRRFYTSLLLVSALILFVFAILAAYRETSPEWKVYRSEYRKLFIEKAPDEFMREQAESIDFRVQQVYLGRLNRIDRCTNCHLGVENPIMADVELPYRQHSGDLLDNHPVNEFGCTVCHNGQGRATNRKDAHGLERDTHWDYPILPAKYIQSSCAKCHDLAMLEQFGALSIVKGEKLFREKGCQGCHKLDGVGGVLGKPLDGIGSQPFAYFPMRHIEGEKTAYNWLKEHFDDPRAIVPESEMRIVGMTDEDAELLTTFVLTIRSTEIQKDYRRIREAPFRELDGESLYGMYCIACHTSGQHSIYDEIFRRTIPAIMNPAFLKVADDGQLKKFIEDGREDTPMTDWKADAAGLTDEEINRIVAFLSANRPEEEQDPFGLSIYEGDVQHGEQLYKVRCALCHGENGRGGEGVLGISLTNPVVQNADPEFLLLTVRDGRRGTPMIPFGTQGVKLSDQDIVDVVAYVRTFRIKKDLK